MREQIRQLLKEEFRVLALRIRTNLDITQDKMGELLEMHKNSYAEIENGANLCGSITLVLLLLQLDEPTEYISYLGDQIKALYEKELQKQ